LLCNQLGWAQGHEILSAPANDPAALAACVVALFWNEALWQQVRDSALYRLEQENGLEDFTRAVASVLMVS